MESIVRLRISTSRGPGETSPELLATDARDVLEVSAHDELVAGARPSDVQPLLGPVPWLCLVDGKNDDTSLEPLEAEGVAVEDLILAPERGPVLVLSLRLPAGLLGMA